jgi:hypothetical protein
MKTFAASMLSLLLVACVTTRQAALPTPGYGMEGVKSGDTVVVHLLNGDRQRFEVNYVDVVGIHGWNETFAYAEIRSVDVVETHYQAANVLTAFLLIGMLVALYSLEPVSFSGPFCVYSSSDGKPNC